MKAGIKLKGLEVVEFKPLQENEELPEGYDVIWDWEVWMEYINSKTTTYADISKEIQILAESFQDYYYDDKAIGFCLNLKYKLNKLDIDFNNSLIYQMLESCERWIQNIWAKALIYEKTPNISLIDIDFYESVGEPPCQYRDILWVLDENSTGFRLLEPDRIVNTDINYYKSY